MQELWHSSEDLSETADATCPCSQARLHEKVKYYEALDKAHNLPMYPFRA